MKKYELTGNYLKRFKIRKNPILIFGTNKSVFILSVIPDKPVPPLLIAFALGIQAQ